MRSSDALQLRLLGIAALTISLLPYDDSDVSADGNYLTGFVHNSHINIHPPVLYGAALNPLE